MLSLYLRHETILLRKLSARVVGLAAGVALQCHASLLLLLRCLGRLGLLLALLLPQQVRVVALPDLACWCVRVFT